MLAMIAAAAIWLLHIVGESDSEDSKNLALDSKDPIVDAAKEVPGIAESVAETSVAEHIYSHRGSEGIEEHSFKAYDEAIEAGSKYIEQDVVLSSDGVLFVSHDVNASFMTDTNANYSDMTASEIESLRTRAGGKVLRLSEVFDKYGKDIKYLVELKTYNSAIIEAFENIIEKYGFEDIVIVQSEYVDSLRVIEEKYPNMQKLLVCKDQETIDVYKDMDYIDIMSVKYDAGLMTEENCKAVHEKGKIFSVWTISDESSIKKAIDMGVDTYFTNDTALAMSIEKDYGLKVRK